MKKRALTAMLITSLIVATLSGCSAPKVEVVDADGGSITKATTTTAAPTEPAPATEETSAETETSEQTEQTEQTEETEITEETTASVEIDMGEGEVISESELLYGLDGAILDTTQALSDHEYGISFGFAYYRTSSGFYMDSETNPESFDLENYGVADVDFPATGSWTKVKTGDTICGLEVASAETSYMKNYDGQGNTALASNSITLSGELTFDAIVQYYSKGDELYIAPGDLYVIPDPRADKGFPIPIFSAYDMPIGGFSTVMEDFAMMGDTLAIKAGNIDADYAETDFADKIGGKSHVLASVTVSDITIGYNTQFGLSTNCKIKAITLK